MNNNVFAILIIFVITISVFLFSMIIIRLYIQKTTKHNQILFQKDLDFQKTINNTILETQEQVLQNISQELHDDAGQQLTVINFQLENLKLDSTEFNTALQPISKSVAELSKSIRNISHSLNNQLLSQIDLIKAIETEINRLEESKTITITFIKDSLNDKFFDKNQKIVIYRIFQEIINNILKHSNASVINIDIKNHPKFELKITDNGQGFDLHNIYSKKQALGIQNITDRAKIINFDVHFFTKIDNGTTVTLSEK